jgi:hypothetical protein
VLEQNRDNLATARAYLEGHGSFPQRAALNHLGGRFLTDFYLMVANWVEWATDVVERWPNEIRDAPFDVDEGEESLRRAALITSISHGDDTTRRSSESA